MKDRLSQQMLMTVFFTQTCHRNIDSMALHMIMGLNVRYASEVDCSCGTMQDKECE